MSNKEFNSMIDFQLILDELEKISFEHQNAGIGSGKVDLKNKLEEMKEESLTGAAEDLNNIFMNSVKKNVQSLGEVPEPLTKKESEAFDTRYNETIENIKILKKKISVAKSILKQKIEEENGYTLDLKNRQGTKEAAKRFFKESKDSISYEDYLLAREFKNSQNRNEALDFFKEEED